MARILVVDTDTELSFALARAMAREPLEIEVAETHTEALSVAASGEPLMVFVRTRAGDRGAARLIGKLRAMHPPVPVAVVAAEPRSEDEILLRREGILCYLQEPVSEKLLRQVVRGATTLGHASWFRGGTQGYAKGNRRTLAVKENTR